MTSWIFPNNPENYAADDELSIAGFIDWGMVKNTKNIQIGDIVYLYVSTPIMEIKWKCDVLDVGYYMSSDPNDYTRSRIITSKYNVGPCIYIKANHRFVLNDMLQYSELKKNGLKSRLMGTQHTGSQLENYLISVEQLEKSPASVANHLSRLSSTQLKVLAVKNSVKQPKQTISTTTQYVRNPYVAQYAKTRANGVCQLCGNKAPFLDSNGNPYLESHHIVWLSNGGADSIDNTTALCPNCHRKMHVVADRNDIVLLQNKNKGL